MGTTVTLDEDVAEAINRELRRRPRSTFKEIVNDLIRAGLHVHRAAARAPRFTVKARPMGLRGDLNYDDVGGLLSQIEDVEHR